jgi:NADPH-dependent 2,4-dienoyl-CoA reductase/sulfur reductase-like enzyme/rhodanese-related sulfurtransferase
VFLNFFAEKKPSQILSHKTQKRHTKRANEQQTTVSNNAHFYRPSPTNTMKIVIIGGVAGGASAAARARRIDEKADIMMLQSGPDVSFASCGMPYFIGGEIKDRHAMAVQTPESLYQTLNIDVRVNTRVHDINTTKKTVTAKNEVNGEIITADYDQLILAVGSEPFKPPIPGIDRPGLFALRNLVDMDHIYAWIDHHEHKESLGVEPGASEHKEEKPAHNMHCVVAGAGFVGLEMVEQLMRRRIDVTLVEMMPQILGPLDVEMAMILQQELERRGVRVVTGDAIAEFKDAPNGSSDASVVVLRSGIELPPAEMTILGLGVRPDTKLVQDAGIECTPRGYIVVDDHLRTSVPDVWAVGDAIEVRNPILGGDEKWAVALAGPANRQGRMVADNIYGMERAFKGTWAASTVRIFDLHAACVGMNEKMCKAKSLPFTSVHVHPGSHAGYYPGAKSINLKLVFNQEDGTLYGAQAVGEDGVEKRIDVISTAMQGKLSVEDLAELELCYAPPVGSAKDPVNIAGMAAQNIVEGVVKQIDWKDLENAAHDPNICFLDVRNPGEIEKYPVLVKGTLTIPLKELRGRLTELPSDKKLVVSCMSGQRAYYACRILSQNGFDEVYNLSGAYKTVQTTPDFHTL